MSNPKTLSALDLAQAKTVDDYLDTIRLGKILSLANSSAVLLTLRQSSARKDPETDKRESDRRRTELAAMIVTLIRNAPSNLRLEIAYRLEYEIRRQWKSSVADVVAREKMDMKSVQVPTDNGLARIFAMAMAMQAEANAELRETVANQNRVEALRTGAHHQLTEGAGI